MPGMIEASLLGIMKRKLQVRTLLTFLLKGFYVIYLSFLVKTETGIFCLSRMIYSVRAAIFGIKSVDSSSTGEATTIYNMLKKISKAHVKHGLKHCQS